MKLSDKRVREKVEIGEKFRPTEVKNSIAEDLSFYSNETFAICNTEISNRIRKSFEISRKNFQSFGWENFFVVEYAVADESFSGESSIIEENVPILNFSFSPQIIFDQRRKFVRRKF